MQAALECVAEFGYHGATMDRIVERAGLSRGAQMHHFPTKLDLMITAFDFMLERLVDDLRAHTEKIRERRERPEEVIEYLWENYFSGFMFSVTMEFVVAARSDPVLRERASVVSNRFHQRLDDCWYLLYRMTHVSEGRLVLILNLTITLLRGMGFQKVLWDRPDYFRQLLQEWLSITKQFFEATRSEERTQARAAADTDA